MRKLPTHTIIADVDGVSTELRTRVHVLDGCTDPDALIGQRAVFRTYEGVPMVGTITEWDGWTALITFADGRHGRSSFEIEMVV